MNTYKMYNHSEPDTFEGLNLEYCASIDESAIGFAEVYAKKLGWSHYTVVEILDLDGNERLVYVI